MAKMRVHELAKELEIESKSIVAFLKGTEYEVKTAQSGVEDAAQEMVRKNFGKKSEAPKAEAPKAAEPKIEKKEAPKTETPAKAEEKPAPVKPAFAGFDMSELENLAAAAEANPEV